MRNKLGQFANGHSLECAKKGQYKQGHSLVTSKSTQYKKGEESWSKQNPESMPRGENHSQWKGGVANDRAHINKWKKERRHRLGISKKYSNELGISKTKEYKRLHNKKYKTLRRGGGELEIKTIQLVYEDNIKKYGTLTCIYCLQPIEFRKDTLEHKQPLSKGGTNEYNNLGIACRKCNSSKNAKTEQVYRKGI